MNFIVNECDVADVLDAAIMLSKVMSRRSWEERYGSFTTPCREHGPRCESWPRCSADAYNEHMQDLAKQSDKLDADVDAFLARLQREMRRRATTHGLTDEAQRAAVRNALLVCDWNMTAGRVADEERPLDATDAGLLTRSLAIAAKNPSRTPAESSRFRLACIEAGALAMLLGEKRPGIE